MWKSFSIIISIFVIFLIPNSLISDGWIRINPKQLGPSVNDVIMVTNDTIFAVGQNGLILSTFDSGNNWISSDSTCGISSTLNGIYFRDMQNGYAIGDNGIVLKTKNAGITWTLNKIDTYYDDVILNDVFFLDSLNGFISGYEYDNPSFMQQYYIGALWSTSDGGNTWQKVNLPFEWSPHTNFFTELYFMNADIGWYYGKGDTVFKTIDGGNNWQKTPWINNQKFVNLFFISNSVGWSLADQFLYKTYDGGVTWNKIFEVSDERFNEIFFLNEYEGIIIGSTWYYTEDNSRIWKTYDGGNSWKLIYTGYENLKAVHFKNNNGWIVGAHGIKLSTVDRGNTWNSEVEKSSTREYLYSTFFADSLHGWIVGFHGVILKTVDGGKNWIKSNLDIHRLSDVYFTNKNIGWIVGQDGYAFSTKDGGNTWQKRKISEDYSLRSIYFINERIGWIVSDKTIYATSDEGINWSKIGPSFKGIWDIFFINDRTGWLVTSKGSEGKVYKTVNGGHDWSLLHTSDAEGFQEIQFINKDRGWIKGSESLFRTTDGGKSWEKINVIQSSEYPYPRGIFFIDEWTGWYCSQHIFKTIDGGDSWTIQHYEYNTFLNDIYFTTMNKGCIVGSDGTLLITNDGGGDPKPIKHESQVNSILRDYRNYPNPFNTTTTIEYDLLYDAQVKIYIYNILGKNIAKLLNNFQEKGLKQVVWDGKNIQGKKLASGIYIYTIIANNEKKSQKMILLR